MTHWLWEDNILIFYFFIFYLLKFYWISSKILVHWVFSFHIEYAATLAFNERQVI